MYSPDESDLSTTGAIERPSRAVSRRMLINGKRHRQTDVLPRVNAETPASRLPVRQLGLLREENARLHRELDALQAQVEELRTHTEQLEGEIETIHSGHQQEIEQYQHHLREMMEERNQMQELNQQLDSQYQDLYHSFQDAVEEEANKMVKEAAQTLILSPEHTPALLSDVVKTLEEQVRQTEDQRTAELLALMRQAQQKALLLEHEVELERTRLETERQNLLNLQRTVQEQAQLRYESVSKRLQARWTTGVTVTTCLLLILLPVLQTLTYGLLKWPLAISLIAPIFVCMFLAYILAHMHLAGRLTYVVQKQAPKKSGAKPAAKPAAKTAAKPATAKK